MHLPEPDDPILREWLPLANAADIPPGGHRAFVLAGRPLVAWRTPQGALQVWHDQCPHRGAKLSLGRVADGSLVCPYHGWVFDASGRCTRQPAQPRVEPPPAAHARVLPVAEKYGVVWTCLGEPARELALFPEDDRPGARRINLAPVEVATSAPRLMENFLDMAHFPFVHAHILGAEPRTEVGDYTVEVSTDRVVARDCLVWQPSGMPDGRGADIEYVYEVRAPFAAMLTKVAAGARGPGANVLHILLALSPVDELRTRGWLVSVFENETASDQALYDFNAEIFGQDVPIVESQSPRWLPLEAGTEVAQRCDAISRAYRRWLLDRGWRYGTSRGAAAR